MTWVADRQDRSVVIISGGHSRYCNQNPLQLEEARRLLLLYINIYYMNTNELKCCIIHFSIVYYYVVDFNVSQMKFIKAFNLIGCHRQCVL